MKLLTKEIIAKFEKTGRQEDTTNPLIILKIFNPAGGETWYMTEYDPENKEFYGYITGSWTDEWGYSSLEKMEAVKGPIGIGLERDRYFGYKRFEDVIKPVKTG